MMTAARQAATVRRADVLSLYRSMLRAANAFASYNFRRYFVDRIQRGFREHQHEADPKRVSELIAVGRQELGVLRRQSTINGLYSKDKLVVE